MRLCRQGNRTRQQRAHHQGDLQDIEGIGGQLRVPCGCGIEQEADNHHQKQVERDKHIPWPTSAF